MSNRRPRPDADFSYAVMLTGMHSQPGWFIGRCGAGMRSAVGVGRRPPLFPGTDWSASDLASTANAPALPTARQVVHMAPIWLLPALLARLPAPPQRIVALSSTSARTKTSSPDRLERAAAVRIAAAEQEVLAWAEANGASCVMLRCTLIYGHPSIGAVAALGRWIRRLRVLPVPRSATGLRQPVHAADVARAVSALAEGEMEASGCFELGGGERLAFMALVRRVFRAQGVSPRVVPVPGRVLRAGLTVAQRLALSGLTPGLVDRLANDQVAEDDRLWNKLGIAPRGFEPEPSGPPSDVHARAGG